MANRSYYYVLVLTDNGQGKFVTHLDYANSKARWSATEEPLPMAKSQAEDISYLLCLNLHPAVVVKSHFRIESHWFVTEVNSND